MDIDVFCMLRGASQPLWNTAVCLADHREDNTIVHGPTERIVAHFSGKKTSENGAKMRLCSQRDQCFEDYISKLVTPWILTRFACCVAPPSLGGTQLFAQQITVGTTQ